MVNSSLQGEINDIQEYLDLSKTMFEKSLNNFDMKESKFEDFYLHKIIGLGAYGRVWLVNHKSDDNIFLAMKIMKKEQVMRKNNLRHILNEKRFLAAIRHPFIVHMMYYGQDSANLYIVMPFAIGGDLFGLLSKKGSLDEFGAQFYSGQMVLALEYLHAMDIIYRDLKPENVLIDEFGFIKLTDLGLSKRIIKHTTTMCGTPQYLAPEVITIQLYGKPVDWWALGVILYEMVTGTVPFNAENDNQLYSKIISGKIIIPRHFSSELSDIIINLLQADPKKRYGTLKNGVDDIRRHGWYKTMDWILLYNKKVEVPFKPDFTDFKDTSNFEIYEDENDKSMNSSDIDQTYFNDF